jgi:hypothetical protein
MRDCAGAAVLRTMLLIASTSLYACQQLRPALPEIVLTTHWSNCASEIGIDAEGQGFTRGDCASETLSRNTGKVSRNTQKALLAEVQDILDLAATTRCAHERPDGGDALTLFVRYPEGVESAAACVRPDGSPKPPLSTLRMRIIRLLDPVAYESERSVAPCSLEEGCSYAEGSCGDGIANGAELCDGLSWREGTSNACHGYGLGSGTVGCTAYCGLDFGACEQTDYCTAHDLRGNGRCDPCNLTAWDDLGQPAGLAADPDCLTACGQDGVCADHWSTSANGYVCLLVGLADPDCSCGNGSVEGAAMTAAGAADGVQELCDDADPAITSCADWGLGTGQVFCTLYSCYPSFSDCQLRP